MIGKVILAPLTIVTFMLMGSVLGSGQSEARSESPLPNAKTTMRHHPVTARAQGQPVEKKMLKVEVTRKCGVDLDPIRRPEFVSLIKVCEEASIKPENCEYVSSRVEVRERQPPDSEKHSGFKDPVWVPESEEVEPSNGVKFEYWLLPHENCEKGEDGKWRGPDSILKLDLFVTVKAKSSTSASDHARADGALTAKSIPPLR